MRLQLLAENADEADPGLDRLGGVLPSDPAKAKTVDLITLPEGVEGTNCSNCKYVDDGFCTHPKVKMKVNERNCCALWDAKGVLRIWKD